jgi:uncharacterized protein (DUF58 family)
MGILQRVVGAVLGLLFLLAVFVFASLVLGALIAVGIVIWAWVWWRTRSLRRSGRGGAVIEGEFRDVTAAPRVDKRERP